MVSTENYKSFKKEIIDTLAIKNPEKYEFSSGINIAIGRVIIRRTGTGEVIQYLDESCNKEYMSKWIKQVGHILCRDLKKKNIDRYFELELSNYKVLLRTIDEEELKDFENNSELVDNIIKCNGLSFLIIKIIENESTYAAKEIITTTFDIDDDNNNDEEDNEDEDEDEEYEITSKTLFDENE